MELSNIQEKQLSLLVLQSNFGAQKEDNNWFFSQALIYVAAEFLLPLPIPYMLYVNTLTQRRYGEKASTGLGTKSITLFKLYHSSFKWLDSWTCEESLQFLHLFYKLF